MGGGLSRGCMRGRWRGETGGQGGAWAVEPSKVREDARRKVAGSETMLEAVMRGAGEHLGMRG